MEPNDVRREWAQRRFGADAAEDVISALQESRTILLKGLSCNGIDLLGVGSEFNPRLWLANESKPTRFHLFGRPGKLLVDVDDNDAVTSEQFTAFQMKSRSVAIDDFENDQRQAMEAAVRGRQHIEHAKPMLADDDYKMLAGIFDNAVQVLTAMRLLGLAAYASNLLLDNFDRIDDPQRLHREAIGELDAFLAKKTLDKPIAANIARISAAYKGRRQPAEVNTP